MLLFGVTGGIGSGKSKVCELLQARGIPIIQADPLAKQLTATSSDIREGLIAAFGPDIYLPNGKPNKDKLTRLVFGNPETRQKVNEIIHPAVLTAIQEQASRLQAERQARLVGVEAALIYESEMERILNAVVVVDAPLEQRLKWLQQRDGLTREQIVQRMASQMLVDEKKRLADYVIENTGDLRKLEAEVDHLVRWLHAQL